MASQRKGQCQSVRRHIRPGGGQRRKGCETARQGGRLAGIRRRAARRGTTAAASMTASASHCQACRQRRTQPAGGVCSRMPVNTPRHGQSVLKYISRLRRRATTGSAPPTPHARMIGQAAAGTGWGRPRNRRRPAFQAALIQAFSARQSPGRQGWNVIKRSAGAVPDAGPAGEPGRSDYPRIHLQP